MKTLGLMALCGVLLLPAATAMGGQPVMGIVTINMGTMTTEGLSHTLSVMPGDSFDILVYLTSPSVTDLLAGQFHMNIAGWPNDPADYFTLTGVNFVDPWSNDPIDLVLPSLPENLNAGNLHTSGLMGSMMGNGIPSANADFAILSMLVSPSAQPGSFAFTGVNGSFADLDLLEDILGVTGQTLYVTVLPEPSMMGLMLIGFAILRAGRSRRMRA